MNIKTQTKGSTHTVIEKGRYTIYDLQTDTTSRFEGGNHQVNLELRNRTGQHFNLNYVQPEGNIVNIQRVTATDEAIFLSASARKRLHLFGQEEVLPQVKIDRIGAPADIFVAGVDRNGTKRFGGQTILPKDGSYATVTPGKEAVGEITILLIG